MAALGGLLRRLSRPLGRSRRAFGTLAMLIGWCRPHLNGWYVYTVYLYHWRSAPFRHEFHWRRAPFDDDLSHDLSGFSTRREKTESEKTHCISGGGEHGINQVANACGYLCDAKQENSPPPVDCYHASPCPTKLKKKRFRARLSNCAVSEQCKTSARAGSSPMCVCL